MHRYTDQRRTDAERSVFLLSVGAAVQNLMLALHAEGLGSAWISSTLFCQNLAAEVLDLPPRVEPWGAVAVGEPGRRPVARDRRLGADYLAYGDVSRSIARAAMLLSPCRRDR